MNDEDAFQAALDADPSDRTTRLVFADWLQERGDERAEGYRALAALRLAPVALKMGSGVWIGKTVWFFGPAGHGARSFPRRATLPAAWFENVEKTEGGDQHWRRFLTRRQAEDAAAVAFAKLPPERRAELLSGKRAEPTTATPKRKAKPKNKPKGKK